MSSKHPFDWLGFFVQFFFGALFGAAVGFATFAKSPFAGSQSATPALCWIGLSTLACGLIAGFIGDRFWHSI